MSPELERRLCREFPHLTSDYGGDMRATCMHWGFDVSDGWFEILRTMLGKLETARLKLPPEQAAHVKLAQVKEKYGGLRVYLTCYPEGADKILEEASKASYETCEICGSTQDVTTEGGWLTTECRACREGPK